MLIGCQHPGNCAVQDVIRRATLFTRPSGGNAWKFHPAWRSWMSITRSRGKQSVPQLHIAQGICIGDAVCVNSAYSSVCLSVCQGGPGLVWGSRIFGYLVRLAAAISACFLLTSLQCPCFNVIN